MLCSHAVDTVDHLFLSCPKIQQIWFLLGKSQDYMQNWTNCHDIMQFSLLPLTVQLWCVLYQFTVTLNATDVNVFLLVYSAIC